MKYERIRNLREDADMTQTQIGRMLNISQRAYAHYECGSRDIPVDILVEIANIYNVSTDYLLNRTDKKEILE